MNECNLTFDYSALIRLSPSKSNRKLLPQALPHEVPDLSLQTSALIFRFGILRESILLPASSESKRYEKGFMLNCAIELFKC